MMWFVVKSLLSGVIVATVSEVARRSPGFGALVASLPMFLVMPLLMRSGMHFWLALAAGCAVTVLLYAVMTLSASRLGIQL